MGHPSSPHGKGRSSRQLKKSASTVAASMVHASAAIAVPKSAISIMAQTSTTSSVANRSQPVDILSLTFELRTKVLLDCMQGRYLNVARDRHGRLRISNLPATAQTSKQLRRETLSAVFVYGIFVVQSSASNAQFQRQLASTIPRLPHKTALSGLQLVTKLNFATFSHFPGSGVSSSLAFAAGCPNLRVLTLNIELQHMTDPDWSSPNWYKTVAELRAEFDLDDIFLSRQLRTLILTGTGIGLEDDYIFSGSDDLAKFFKTQYIAMHRTTEVLLEAPPDEVWPEEEEEH